MKYSIFGGTGFIGGHFCDRYSEDIIIQGRERIPNKNILTLFQRRQYNIFKDILDVETNLKVLCKY